MFKNMLSSMVSLFSAVPDKSLVTEKGNDLVLVDTSKFTDEDYNRISIIKNSCKLDFLFINDYGKDIFMETANLFSDDIIGIQSTVIDNATNKLNEILDMLTKMDEKNFDILAVKEINLLTHFYRDKILKYIITLNERKNKGLDFFKEYDIYIEAGNQFILESSVDLDTIKHDPLEKHIQEDNAKNIERFKDKLFKLRTNKLYHSQSLLQMGVLHSVSEKIYEQMDQIIYIVIPVLKNKSSINISIDHMKRIKNNLLSIKEDKDKKIKVNS